MTQKLMRHVAAATALRLPGRYRGLWLGAEQVGYVLPAVAERLAGLGALTVAEGVAVADAAALAHCTGGLAAAGVYRVRGEAFDVRASPGGPVLAQVDRGALPCLGIAAEGVHVNGLVRGANGWSVWVALRAATRALDPGKLDHMVAGGICAGMDAAETLVKEAAEEAGVPATLARQARPAGVISYDLELPADFVPVPRDGEVERFMLMPVAEVMRLVAETDAFKFNVNLVLIELFERLKG